MKKLINILMLVTLLTGLTGCWEDEIVSAGAPRPQVENLKAVPGDEEALLTWTVPDGWNPTDFIITYQTPESKEVKIHTGKTLEFNVGELANDYQYTFEVQAVYDKLISGAVSAVAKPSTSRFPVTDLVADGSDATVELKWTRPSLLVQGYTLTYASDATPGDVKTVEIGADAESYTVKGLTNDINHSFSLVARYQRGNSLPATVKAMPTLAIAYFLSANETAMGVPVEFTFNREAYTTAANVTWTFPGNIVKSGDKVQYAFTSKGTQQVVLSAQVGNFKRQWTIEINVREYALFNNEWVMDGTTYNGFKGSCPVFSPDGKTVYDITFNKITSLYAFDTATGNRKWVYIPEAASGSYNMLTVNPVTGDIYFGTTSAGQFYCVNHEGQLRWKFTEAQSMQSAAPAVNTTGSVVYIADKNGNTFALDAESGAKKWGVTLGAPSAAMLVNGTELVVATTTGGIFFLNVADGSTIANVKPSKNIMDLTGFAVASDKRTAYIGGASGAMNKVDIVAHTLIIDSYVDAGITAPNSMYEPVIAPNGDVFVGSKDSYAYCFDKDLNLKWKFQAVNATNGFNYSHPCVDTQGNYYITSGQTLNRMLGFSSTGEVILDVNLGGDATADRQMGGNNLLNGVLYSAFIGAASKNGLLVGYGVGYDRASSWSTHGGDPCGSCCVK